jgi:hypothetical protein
MTFCLMTDAERAECARLGLECTFEPHVPEKVGDVDSAWRIDGELFAFCDNVNESRQPVVALHVGKYPSDARFLANKRRMSIHVDDITIERILFIQRVCRRIVEDGGCRRARVGCDAERRDVVERYRAGQTVGEIRRQTERSRKTIIRWLRSAGVWKEAPRIYADGGKGDKPWTKPELLRLRQMREQGVTFKEIAKILGRSHDGVRCRHGRLVRTGT